MALMWLIVSISVLILTQEASLAAPGRVKCIPPLGCFNIDGAFYHPIYRPINLYPMDRQLINVRYRIYTKGSGEQFQLLQAIKLLDTNVSEINVNPELETKLVVHGWIDDQLIGDWMRVLRDEYFKKGDYNYIVVDWSGGNAPPYTQGVANTRVVGAEMALLINTLKNKKGLDPRKVHLIGHSLGGQIVGYAGALIKNLGRITSLDPAEPLYQNMPPEVRIDPTDAEFVDVIHSDSPSILIGGLGMSQLAGHVDFFPNNGRNQPGCNVDKVMSIAVDGLVEGVRNILACNHIRAVNYFRESINSKCQQVHFACPDWATYLAGKCAECGSKGEKCAILGDRAIEYANYKRQNNTIQMFGKTNSASPYCLYQYQVVLKLEAGAKKDQKGELHLKIMGEYEEKEFPLGDKEQTLYHGAQYTYLITTKEDMGKIRGVSLRWKAKKLSIILSTKLFLEQIKVSPMNEMDIKTREAETFYACAKNSGGISSGKTVAFRTFSKC